MPWIELSIEAPPEYVEPISHLFARHGDGRVAIEEAGGFNPDEGEEPDPGALVTVRGYLAVDNTAPGRKAAIEAGLRLIDRVCPLPRLTEQVLDESIWERQRFEPVRVGRRLLIAPLGQIPDTSEGRTLVPLEPGLAFGTGHHPTTRMCLEILEAASTAGASVLDVGCGSGILAIAAIKLGAARAVCLDVEEDAVRAARANASAAGVGHAVSVHHTTLPSEQAPAGHFDVVMANISATVLVRLATPLVRCLAPRGVLIVSGVLMDRSDGVSETLEAAGVEIESQRQSGDWVAFDAHRTAPAPER